MKGERLRTQRLELRPTRDEDLAELHALWTDPGVRRFLFDDRSVSLAEAAAFGVRSSAAFEAHGYGLWLAYAREAPERLLGFAGLLPGADAIPGLYYAIRPERWGEGLAGEAASAVLLHAFVTLGLSRVCAGVDEPNVASIRVLEKLGMTRTGRSLVEGRPLLDFETSALPPGMGGASGDGTQ